jgi:hypothetical protein
VMTEPDLKERILGENDRKAFKALQDAADPNQRLTAFNVTRQAVTESLPEAVARTLTRAAVINEGYLQLGGPYQLHPHATAIEDGIVSALARSSPKGVAEKLAKFELKRDWQYDNMVFYMNPLCYRTWDELALEHDIQQVVLYRVIDCQDSATDAPARCTLFMKIIDLKKRGRTMWAGLVRGDEAGWVPDPAVDAGRVAAARAGRVPAEEEAVDASIALFNKFLAGLAPGVLKGSDPILLLNTQSVMYDNSRASVTAKDMAAEDGMVTALVARDFSVVEKLASIYVNPASEYEDTMFYINPLFLEQLDMLLKYSGSEIKKVIAYKKIEVEAAPQATGLGAAPQVKLPEVAGLYIRVIDVSDGNIIYSGIVQNN